MHNYTYSFNLNYKLLLISDIYCELFLTLFTLCERFQAFLSPTLPYSFRVGSF